jgi:hypothetical protein
MTAPQVIAALRPLVEWFEARGVPYRVGGSLASSVHGVARSTLDVDLVAELPEPLVVLFARDLRDSYYLDEETIRDAVRRRSSFNLVHFASMVKVDVFLPKHADYDLTAFERFRREPLDAERPGERFYFVSPEDIVLRKLAWYRAGGESSERQWSDVLGVLRVQAPELDLEYLERWASELGVEDLLARARGEAND